MTDQEYMFEDFLANVREEDKNFVNEVHGTLLRDRYKAKIEHKANGFFVSYSHPKTKRVILNFLFRKKGLMIRLYADNCNKYSDVFDRMPKKIVDQIEKARNCKRLIDPEDCSPRCLLGYDFYIGEKHYQKCRGHFILLVDRESIPTLLELIVSENRERSAA
jgi:hypothetical protein